MRQSCAASRTIAQQSEGQRTKRNWRPYNEFDRSIFERFDRRPTYQEAKDWYEENNHLFLTCNPSIPSWQELKLHRTRFQADTKRIREYTNKKRADKRAQEVRRRAQAAWKKLPALLPFVGLHKQVNKRSEAHWQDFLSAFIPKRMSTYALAVLAVTRFKKLGQESRSVHLSSSSSGDSSSFGMLPVTSSSGCSLDIGDIHSDCADTAHCSSVTYPCAPPAVSTSPPPALHGGGFCLDGLPWMKEEDMGYLDMTGPVNQAGPVPSCSIGHAEVVAVGGHAAMTGMPPCATACSPFQPYALLPAICSLPPTSYAPFPPSAHPAPAVPTITTGFPFAATAAGCSVQGLSAWHCGLSDHSQQAAVPLYAGRSILQPQQPYGAPVFGPLLSSMAAHQSAPLAQAAPPPGFPQLYPYAMSL